jgi:Cu2+-exporting ATPase
MSRASLRKDQLFRVVHELPRRVRIKSRIFQDPSLDVEYLSAYLASIPGVASARINPSAASLVLECEEDRNPKGDVLLALENIPEDAYLADPYRERGPDKLEVAGRAVAAAITPFLPFPVKVGMSWLLAIPSLIEGVETFIGDGLKVEVLDASVKIFSLLRGDYFTSNTVGALLSLASYVEHGAERQSHDLLKSLLQPKIERVRVRRDGVELLIPYEDARVGDLIVIGPGELTPVDGEVLEGEAALNVSSMTGESLPMHAKPGDQIVSGALIEDGKLVVRAERVGRDTSMARIAGYMEKSLRNKSPKQKSAERLADRLTPLTFGAGLGLYALTGDLARAASVLTVDYSCAVKLATPVAVRSAMYAAGQEGVLLKGAQALDALARVDTVLFDKTGTLTKGALQVTDVLPFSELSPDALLALTAGAEEHYAHPVAKAVVAEARERNLDLPAFSQVDFIVAHGVSAHVQGERILAGSRHFLHEDEGVDCGQADELAERLYAEGKTLLYVAKEQRLIGVLALRDSLRPEARRTLQLLKASGVKRLVMLTGDHPRAAEAARAQLPELDKVYADLKPQDKVRVLEELRARGASIAFVGDGVNDAPSLLAADVGVSMPSAADLARDAAQVILLKDDLGGLAVARAVARRTEKTLKTCIWSSLSINSVLLLLAGAGRLPAVAAAAAHNGATIAILAYAALSSRNASISSQEGVLS